MEHTEKEREEEEEEDPREENTVSWGRKEKDSEKVDGGGATKTRTERRERERERGAICSVLSLRLHLSVQEKPVRVFVFKAHSFPVKKEQRKCKGKRGRRRRLHPMSQPPLGLCVLYYCGQHAKSRSFTQKQERCRNGVFLHCFPTHEEGALLLIQ